LQTSLSVGTFEEGVATTELNEIAKLYLGFKNRNSILVAIDMAI